jgi:hypothetical protein
MKTKHTQGEWEVHYFGDNGNRKTRVHCQNVTIANVLQIDEVEANAKLIAAAPELLQALIKANNLLQGLNIVAEEKNAVAIILSDMQDAINKATK